MPIRTWSVGEIRLGMPLRMLASLEKTRWDIEIKAVFDLTVQDFKDVDIVVIQRQASPFIVRLARKLTKFGIPYIFEIDDYLWGEMPANLESSGVWRRRRKELISLMQHAAAVTTTTARLASKIKPLNKKTVVIPNALPPMDIDPGRSVDSTPTIIIASTDNMAMDEVIPALQRIKSEYEIQIVAIGIVASQLQAAGMEIVPYPILDYTDFCLTIRRFVNAVGLIPCDTSDFSQCKSPVKFLSYAAAKIPVVASDTPPYSDIMEPDVTGKLVKNNSAAWYEAIREMLCKRGERDRYVDNCSQRNFTSLEQSALLWERVFSETLEQTDSTGHLQIKKLPSAFDWSFFRYTIDINKYRSLFRLLKQNGISTVFSLFRKGM